MSDGPTRIHVTEVDRALSCLYRDAKQRSGEWQYVQRPETIRGSAVHKAREVALRAVLAGHDLPSVDDAAGIADAEVEAAWEAANLPPDDADPVREEAALFARADRLLVLPSLAPHVLAVEEEIELPVSGNGMDGSYVLTGRPDSVARSPIGGRLEVPDLKTSGNAPSQAVVNSSTQHSLYSALVESKYGEKPVHSIHHLRVMAKGPRNEKPNVRVAPLSDDPKAPKGVLTTLYTERDAGGVASGLARLRALIDAREQGYALPASAGFLSECHRCPHRGHPDPSQRCRYVPATRINENGGDDAE